MRTKVYIANRSGHDFTPAEQYGELVYLTDGTVTVYDTNRIYRMVAEKLNDSSPDDYILPTGISTVTIVAVQCLSLMHNGVVRYLIWKPNGSYEVRVLDVKGLLEKGGSNDIR